MNDHETNEVLEALSKIGEVAAEEEAPKVEIHHWNTYVLQQAFGDHPAGTVLTIEDPAEINAMIADGAVLAVQHDPPGLEDPSPRLDLGAETERFVLEHTGKTIAELRAAVAEPVVEPIVEDSVEDADAHS